MDEYTEVIDEAVELAGELAEQPTAEETYYAAVTTDPADMVGVLVSSCPAKELAEQRAAKAAVTTNPAQFAIAGAIGATLAVGVPRVAKFIKARFDAWRADSYCRQQTEDCHTVDVEVKDIEE